MTKNITRHNGINNVRFTQLFYLLEKEIFSFDVPFNSLSSEAEIELIDNAIPSALYFTPQTQTFTEKATIDNNGKVYQQRLLIDVPKGRLSVDNVLQQIGNNKLFLTYFDKNKQVRVLRNMRLKDSYDLSSSNKYRFEFTGESRTKAIYHTDNTLFDEFQFISDLPYSSLPSTNQTNTAANLIYKDGSNYYLSYMQNGEYYLTPINLEDYPNRIIINQL